MGQIVLTCRTSKPTGPPPHEKPYRCVLYFASFLAWKQESRLLSLLRGKSAGFPTARRGYGRAFIMQATQTWAGL